MKFSVLLLFAIFMQVYGFSIPIIYDTKAEGCVNGTCGAYCALEDAKVFPGEQYNWPGKCQKLYCEPDFSLTFSTCSEFDIYDEYTWVGRDNSKPYPECCGTQGTKKRYNDFD
ncbi:CLUMA_CG018087, isoform A [Clunio marinus]|uniref:CLUMA_CG018087, isoform A n=1 Tax=Clunio marinus TaxID=568069 RepID=A0A1J1J2H5_9DIPT|nr:CLUMA_CG018087, isoform A [Clunio marinus]